jgi:hypothetical protein
MMKKHLWLPALAGLMLMLSGCNSKPEQTDGGYGAYYPYGNYVIATDGTKFTLPVATNNSSSPLNRYFFFLYGTIAEGTSAERGPGVTIPIKTVYESTSTLPTYAPTNNSYSSDGDPIAGMVASDKNPTIGTVLNFLIFNPRFFVFTEKAWKYQAYAEVDFDLEIDSQVVPGAQNDTINMRLHFFNNRAAGEEIDIADGYFANPYYQPFALDLENHNFDETDSTGKNKTYIIKLKYLSYEWNGTGTFDETKVYTKYLTCKWTPADPYGEGAQE